jgi:orotidine-5'-phosphate decarboxylase
MKKHNPLIVALDVDTFAEARGLIDVLADHVDMFKVGSQLFTACGPVVIRYILARGKEVFLDLKFHDIPNTVANAVSAAVGLGAAVHSTLDGAGQPVLQKNRGLYMLTVHIVGGEEMLMRAVEAAEKSAQAIGVTSPHVVGITVLTSEQKNDSISQVVLERARIAKRCGLAGIVSSSQEAALVRKEMGPDFIIVTPGIRPNGVDVGDQKRVMTPVEALAQGSTFLVVGRPIVKAEHPAVVAQQIQQELSRIQCS